MLGVTASRISPDHRNALNGHHGIALNQAQTVLVRRWGLDSAETWLLCLLQCSRMAVSYSYICLPAASYILTAFTWSTPAVLHSKPGWRSPPQEVARMSPSPTASRPTVSSLCKLNGSTDHHSTPLLPPLRRVRVTVPFIHDLTVSSSSSMNVFVDCAGFNLNLDHHRFAFY